MEFASAVPLIVGVESLVERFPPAMAGAVGAVVSIVHKTDETLLMFPVASVCLTYRALDPAPSGP